MNELNPTIKKFYENMYKTEVKTESGNYFYVDAKADGGSGVIFIAFKCETLKALLGLSKSNLVDVSKFGDEEIVYLFDKGSHKEEELLRIIKMKAFL